MAVTRLKRKAKRNKVRSKTRLAEIQRLNSRPVIKSVDVEAIKEEFAKGGAKKATPKKEEAAPKAEKKEAAPKAEKKEAAPKAEKKAAAPKAEKKEAAPKAEKKKAAPKKKAEDK
ncbi:hypothetical protein [Fulvivirga lutimaris]|uniref:hypothetical protein n=1 Tax=Fulvivirga lutimaris TaxID=1819566 RepID=UPI0016270ACC|nr:hypothetical protein [Fulvivirga lutimaris]